MQTQTQNIHAVRNHTWSERRQKRAAHGKHRSDARCLQSLERGTGSPCCDEYFKPQCKGVKYRLQHYLLSETRTLAASRPLKVLHRRRQANPYPPYAPYPSHDDLLTCQDSSPIAPPNVFQYSLSLWRMTFSRCLLVLLAASPPPPPPPLSKLRLLVLVWIGRITIWNVAVRVLT